MKLIAHLEGKKTLRSRMAQVSKRSEQPKVTSAFAHFLCRAFDGRHSAANVGAEDVTHASGSSSTGSSEDADGRRTSSQLENFTWDPLCGSTGCLEASVCAPDHTLRHALMMQDVDKANAKLNSALGLLDRCSFLCDDHHVNIDGTKPLLPLKKDAGPRTLDELAHLRSAVRSVSSALASTSPVAAKRAVRRKTVPKYDAAAAAGTSGDDASSFICDERMTQSQRTSLDLRTFSDDRPLLNQRRASLPAHLSQASSLTGTPMRVMEVDEPLDDQGAHDDQSIDEELLAMIACAASRTLRRDASISAQPATRPSRWLGSPLVIAEENEEEAVTFAAAGWSCSALQLSCMDQLSDSPTLARSITLAPQDKAPTLPAIAFQQEPTVLSLSAAVDEAADINAAQLQLESQAPIAEEPLEPVYQLGEEEHRAAQTPLKTKEDTMSARRRSYSTVIAGVSSPTSSEQSSSSNVPSLMLDTLGGTDYESDASTTSFSTASTSDEVSPSKGKVSSQQQHKLGRATPMRSILPYLNSTGFSDCFTSSTRPRAGSLPSHSRDSLESTTALHHYRTSHDEEGSAVSWELRLRYNMELQEVSSKETRHVRKRHDALAGPPSASERNDQ